MSHETNRIVPGVYNMRNERDEGFRLVVRGSSSVALRPPLSQGEILLKIQIHRLRAELQRQESDDALAKLILVLRVLRRLESFTNVSLAGSN